MDSPLLAELVILTRIRAPFMPFPLELPPLSPVEQMPPLRVRVWSEVQGVCASRTYNVAVLNVTC